MITNAYLENDSTIVALSRGEDGVLKRATHRAEWVAYYRTEALTEAILRMLRSTRFVRGVTEEGEWTRVAYADRRCREDMVLDERSPLAQAGVVAYEGDVHAVARWAADNAIEVAKPRRVYLDIEGDSRVTFADAVEGAARVLVIALVDEDGNEVVRCLDEDSDAAEAELLKWFWSALEPYDQVVAWNGDGYDFLVLWTRTKLLRVRAFARRWIWIDQMEVFAKHNTARSGEENRSFSLDSVAHNVLGRGKLECPDWAQDVVAGRSLGAAAWDLWRAGGRHRQLLVDYCLEDTRCLPAIDKKRPYMSIVDAVCRVCSIFPDTRSLGPVKQLDGVLLKLGRSKGIHFATRVGEGSGEKYKGAGVRRPTLHGIGRGVHVYDFKSLYPTVMITWNMSPETRVPSREAEKDPQPRREDECESATGTRFSTAREGILIEALRNMLSLRDRYKKLAKSLPPGTPEWEDAYALSSAYKVLANGFYGVLGNKWSRFYDPLIAEAITQSARWLNEQTMAEAKRRGWKVVYGDSVSGDRVVVAKDPAGRVQLLPVSVLWERAVAGHSERGKEFAEMPEWKALARDVEGAEGWFPLERVVRHRAGKKTWRISTKHGQTQVTTDHGIMCGGVEIRPEDFVSRHASFSSLRAPRERVREVVDLAEYVRGVEYRSAGDRTVARFEAVGDWLIFETPYSPAVRVRRFYERGSQEMASLLRLVGAYVSDGSASVCGDGAVRSLLSFCKADLDLQKRIARDLGVVAPDLPIFGPYWTETVYVVRSGTHAMPLLFRALCGAGSKNKRLPDFVYELDDVGYQDLLGALEDGDGLTDESGAFLFTTTSQQLAAGVSYLLSQRGADHGWSFRESKGAWTIRTRRGKERATRYSIKSEVFEADPSEWVYDLTVSGAHTFVDGIGRVLLHNTDSGYLQGPSEKEMEAFRDWCNATYYPGLVYAQGCRENAIMIAYEKEYRRLIFSRAKDGEPGAKQYCGAYEHAEGKRATAESKPEIKGLAYVRGDATRLAAALQGEVIDMLVGGLKIAKGPVPTDDVARYREVIERHRRAILDGPLSLSDVEKTQGLERPLKDYAVRTRKDGQESRPAHVEVAEILKARGREIRQGTKISYVIADGSKSPMRVIPAEDYTGTECDRYFLWESLVYPPTKALLEGAFPPVDERRRPIPEHDWDRFLRVRPRPDRHLLAGQIGLFGSSNDARISSEPGAVAEEKEARRILVDDGPEDVMIDLELAVRAHPGDELVEVCVRGIGEARFSVDFGELVDDRSFLAVLSELGGEFAA